MPDTKFQKSSMNFSKYFSNEGIVTEERKEVKSYVQHIPVSYCSLVYANHRISDFLYSTYFLEEII